MQNSSIAIGSSPVLVSSKSRILALDTQRGLIMCLMALSHCQEYLASDRYSSLSWKKPAEWLGTSTYDLVHQAFISLIASGGFFMMMGLGITLLFEARIREGWPLSKICRYLVTRGSFLIFIQFTVLQLFEFMAEEKIYVYVGVLFSLGVCMIMASLLLYCAHVLSDKIDFVHYFLPLLFFLAIPTAAHLVMQSIHVQGDILTWAQIILLVGGKHVMSGIEISIDFTPLPWFPAVAWGLILGRITIDYKNNSFSIIFQLAFFFLISWFLIRFANIAGFFDLGDYRIFNDNAQVTMGNFFTMTKYPPSISYFLWSLGINMMCLSLWNTVLNFLGVIKLSEILQVFGRSALFFFITHWFIYYGLSQFFPGSLLTLPAQFCVWLSGLFILYFICKAFYPFKMKQDRNSFWRML